MATNDRTTGKLTASQQRAAVEFAASGDAQSAAAVVGVSERTFRRWRATEAFQEALREAETEAMRAVSRRLGALAENALSVLDNLMSDAKTSAGQRIRAASIILDTALKWRQHAELEGRLVALESKLTERKKR